MVMTQTMITEGEAPVARVHGPVNKSLMRNYLNVSEIIDRQDETLRVYMVIS
jgi:hypothetical protein